MRILVAGGAGFIGLHLAKRLFKEGNDVLVIDNLSTGSAENVDILKNSGITFFEYDICNPIEQKIGQLDAIFNLACPASPVDFCPKAIDILAVCSKGIFNLLELAREHNASFLQASTSECYGDPKINPQNEAYWGNVNPIGPRSCYDEGKRFAEALTMAYHRKYGLKTHLARIFNTYGPNMRNDDGRVLPNFISQAFRNEPLTVYGDGTQTRSFCYVDDLVDGLIKLMASDYVEPVNIGNPDEITILQLAKEVIELTGSKSRIKFLPLPTDDPKIRCPDITLARKLLNWQPTTDRITGITRTIEYFRRYLKIDLQ